MNIIAIGLHPRERELLFPDQIDGVELFDDSVLAELDSVAPRNDAGLIESDVIYGSLALGKLSRGVHRLNHVGESLIVSTRISMGEKKAQVLTGGDLRNMPDATEVLVVAAARSVKSKFIFDLENSKALGVLHYWIRDTLNGKKAQLHESFTESAKMMAGTHSQSEA